MANTKIRNLLTEAGRQSLNYFVIHRRIPSATVAQLNIREFGGIEWFVKYPELRLIIRAMLNNPLAETPGNTDANAAYPTKDMAIINIATLSSKAFRLNQLVVEDLIICVYKNKKQLLNNRFETLVVVVQNQFLKR